MNLVPAQLNRLFIGLAALFFLLNIWFSVGFHHFDEHFQIIEFAGLKLGWTSPPEMPWEYAKAVRSSLQPWLAAGIIKTMNLIGVDSPYTIMLIIRAISGTAVFIAVTRLVRTWASVNGFETAWWLYASVLLFYPLGYIAVRFSSETGALFCLAMGVEYWLRKSNQAAQIPSNPSPFGLKQASTTQQFNHSTTQLLNPSTPQPLNPSTVFTFSLWLGLAFLFRYHIMFMIGAAALWFAITQGIWQKRTLAFVLGFLLVFAFGFLLDDIFYGRPVLSFWNYFYWNIWKKVAAGYGTEPWHFYISSVLKWGPVSVLNLLLIVGAAAYAIRNSMSVLVWMCLAFFLAHSLIAHKEHRFLFPAIPLFCLFAATTFYQWWGMISKTGMKQLVAIGVALCLAVDLAAASVRSVLPASGTIPVYQFIAQHYSNKPLVYYIPREQHDFFEMHAGLKMHFYQLPNHKPEMVNANLIPTLPSGSLLITNGLNRPAGLKPVFVTFGKFWSGPGLQKAVPTLKENWEVYEIP